MVTQEHYPRLGIFMVVEKEYFLDTKSGKGNVRAWEVLSAK